MVYGPGLIQIQSTCLGITKGINYHYLIYVTSKDIVFGTILKGALNENIFCRLNDL